MTCYEYVELSYHIKGMMIQGWIWITWVSYYDMTMMCWSHKWRIVLKENSHAIPNELMTWLYKGLVSYDLY